MIDWLSSKVAMTLAALVLLAGVVGFFLAQKNQVRHDALQSIADGAAAYIDEVSRSPGETVLSLSVGGGETSTLPALAAGEPYSLILYRSYVVAGLDGDRAFAILREPIHLWEPKAGRHTAAEVANQDSLYSSLTVGPGGTVILSRRYLDLEGSSRLETFAFL